MKPLQILKRGIIDDNPTFVQVIGMCPTLAVTTSAINGIGMGLATTAVLSFSNLFISIVRNIIPEQIRIPCYVVITAGITTVIQFIIQAFFPDLNKSLGLFIPLIVVNCIIFARAESFAAKNKPLPSLIDGIGMGLGFTLGLTVLASIREFLGEGSIFGMTVLPDFFPQTIAMILPPGAFFTLGLLIAGIGYLKERGKR